MIGSAWTEWVRPIITVPGLGAGARDETASSRSQSLEQELAGGAQLERQRGVHHVAAGQPEVQVPALGTHRLRHLADEGDDVVVGRPLQLGDAVHVDARARLDGGERVRRDRARAPTCARATAISTRSMCSKRASSDQIAPISGSV